VYFNKIARDVAPIRLTGKFGSEVVRTRNLVPAGASRCDLVQPWLAGLLTEVLPFDQISRRKHPLSRVVSEEIPWFEYGRLAVEQSQITLRTPYMDNDLVKLMYQAPPQVRNSRDLTVRYLRDKGRDICDLPTDFGKMRENGGLIGKAVHTFYRALFKTEYIYFYAMPHWLTRLDRNLEKLKPERIVSGRAKFEAYRIWIKTHLANSIREILLRPGAHCTDFFDKRSVSRIIAGHTAGTHNYLTEIKMMMNIELICSSLLGPAKGKAKPVHERPIASIPKLAELNAR
jgi:asparagine synthase (glutamine-hydrolysing)